ncbi:WD40 repeat domain-containing protein [Actinomadura chokoriensis]|uniref:WD40 repeat domain-containing protein n=1 Tax=Actinomadura chokoriensis TaxID=454156 RepID=A0ABV4R6Y2_9ACTN
MPDAPVAVLGDGGHLAVVDLDTGEVDTYEIDDDLPPVALVGLTDRRVLAVRFDTVELYRLDGPGEWTAPIRQWRIKSDTSVLDVAATASGSRFVVAAGDRFYVGGVDDPDLLEVDSPDQTLDGTAGCLAAYVSPDGATLAVGRAGSIDVYDAAPLRRIRDLCLNEKGDAVLCAALSPDGRRLMTGDDAARTALFDLDGGTGAQVSEGGKVITARWNRDGSACALVVLTRSVGVVDPSGRLLAELTPQEPGTYYFLGGGWAGGGNRFAVGTEHGKILAWTHEVEA